MLSVAEVLLADERRLKKVNLMTRTCRGLRTVPRMCNEWKALREEKRFL